MKTIGIIGGMGPYATVDFFRNILDSTKVTKDFEHIPLVIHNDATVPSRTRAILYNEESPVPRTVENIQSIQDIVDFIVLPCNSIHYWYNDISSKIEKPWLNMLEIVSSVLKPPVLVLGSYVTMEKGLYNKYAETHYLLNKNIVYQSIEHLKLGRNKKVEELKEEVKKYVSENDVNTILLACTELTNIDFDVDIPVIDSSMEYAKACVAISGGTVK